MADDARLPPSRRRGAAPEHAIMRAAIDELVESGYTGLTMDRVAQRAGTNKNAIYRRWPSRAVLTVAAYREMAATLAQLSDTGQVRGDGLELLRVANSTWSSPAANVLRSVLAGVADDPELLALVQEQAGDAGTAMWLTILGRTVARGELRPEALHPRVATVAVVLLPNEYVTCGAATVPDGVLVDIIDEVYVPLLRGRGDSPAHPIRDGV